MLAASATRRQRYVTVVAAQQWPHWQNGHLFVRLLEDDAVDHHFRGDRVEFVLVRISGGRALLLLLQLMHLDLMLLLLLHHMVLLMLLLLLMLLMLLVLMLLLLKMMVRLMLLGREFGLRTVCRIQTICGAMLRSLRLTAVCHLRIARCAADLCGQRVLVLQVSIAARSRRAAADYRRSSWRWTTVLCILWMGLLSVDMYGNDDMCFSVIMGRR